MFTVNHNFLMNIAYVFANYMFGVSSVHACMYVYTHTRTHTHISRCMFFVAATCVWCQVRYGEVTDVGVTHVALTAAEEVVRLGVLPVLHTRVFVVTLWVVQPAPLQSGNIDQ